MFAKAQTEHLL